MNRLTDVDPGLVLVTLTLVVMGLVTIYSASALSAYKMVGEAQYFFHKQFIWSLLGTVACAVIALVPFIGCLVYFVIGFRKGRVPKKFEQPPINSWHTDFLFVNLFFID